MDIYSDEETCRICLTIQETTYSLFNKRKGIFAKEKLEKIGLKLDQNDSGPRSICCNCFMELEMTIMFLEKCEKSNEILAAVYSKGVVTKEIARSQENLKSDSDNNTVDFSQDAPECDLPVISKIDDKISVIIDQKCVTCGSKRRCAHWTPPATHTCPYCQKVFSRKYSFKLHLRRHHRSPSWWCGACGAGAVSRSLAARHCAPPRRRPCPAPGCRRSYTSGTNLRNHLRTHSGERPFQCSDCDKRFSSKDTLKNHIRIHTGALPYICPHCGKQFRTNKLSAHMRVHAGEGWRKRESATCARERATHTCVTCGAIYRHKQSLKKHMRRQHAQKPASAEDPVNQA